MSKRSLREFLDDLVRDHSEALQVLPEEEAVGYQENPLEKRRKLAAKKRREKEQKKREEKNKFTYRGRIQGTLPGASNSASWKSLQNNNEDGLDPDEIQRLYQKQYREVYDRKREALKKNTPPEDKYITQEGMHCNTILQLLRMGIFVTQLLSASTGSGKSYQLIRFIARLKKEFPDLIIVFVVPLISLVSFYTDALNDEYGGTEKRSERFHSYNQVPPGPIDTQIYWGLVTTINSLHRISPMKEGSRVVLVVDELCSVANNIVSPKMKNMESSLMSLKKLYDISILSILCDALLPMECSLVRLLMGLSLESIPRKEWTIPLDNENSFVAQSMQKEERERVYVAVQFSPPLLYALIRNVMIRSLYCLLKEMLYNIYVQKDSFVGIFTTCPDMLWRIVSLIVCKSIQLVECLYGPKQKVFREYERAFDHIVFRVICLSAKSRDFKDFMANGQSFGELEKEDDLGRRIVWIICWTPVMVAGISITHPIDRVYFVVNEIGGPQYVVQGVSRARNVKNHCINGTVVVAKESPTKCSLDPHKRTPINQSKDAIEYHSLVDENPVRSRALQNAADGQVLSVVSAAAQKGEECPLNGILEPPARGPFGVVKSEYEAYTRRYTGPAFIDKVKEAFHTNDPNTTATHIPSSKKEPNLNLKEMVRSITDKQAAKDSGAGLVSIGEMLIFADIVCAITLKIIRLRLLGAIEGQLSISSVREKRITKGSFQKVARLSSINTLLANAGFMSPITALLIRAGIHLPPNKLSGVAIYRRLVGCFKGDNGICHNPFVKHESDTCFFLIHYIRLFSTIEREFPHNKSDGKIPTGLEVKTIRQAVLESLERVHGPFGIEFISNGSVNKRPKLLKSIEKYCKEKYPDEEFLFDKEHDPTPDKTRYTFNGCSIEPTPTGSDLLVRCMLIHAEQNGYKMMIKKNVREGTQERKLLEEFISLLEEYSTQPSIYLFGKSTPKAEEVMESIMQWYTKLKLYYQGHE